MDAGIGFSELGGGQRTALRKAESEQAEDVGAGAVAWSASSRAVGDIAAAGRFRGLWVHDLTASDVMG
jgi:hypothetical protein